MTKKKFNERLHLLSEIGYKIYLTVQDSWGSARALSGRFSIWGGSGFHLSTSHCISVSKIYDRMCRSIWYHKYISAEWELSSTTYRVPGVARTLTLRNKFLYFSI